MKELKNLNDLFIHEVQGLYNTEKYQIMGLERMINNTNSPELKSALQQHLNETKIQKDRLEQVGEIMNFDPNDEGSFSIKGMLVESEKVMHKDATPETMDAAILAGAQKVEHLEISCYGTAAWLAEELGYREAKELLSMSLAEEKKTDQLLNDLAKTIINKRAQHAQV